MADWFAQKRYGFGAGLPIAWQGWLISLAYVGIVTGSAYLVAERSPWAFGSIVVAATGIFMLIAANTTRGGWRWRWGEEPRD